MKKQILALVLLVLPVWSLAGENEALATGGLRNGDFAEGEKFWTPHIDGQGVDCSIEFEGGVLHMIRGETDNYMRTYQDAAVAPGGRYVLHYKVKAKGAGYTEAWILYRRSDGVWLENTSRQHTIFSSRKFAGDWEEVSLFVPAGYDTDLIRICFGVKKKNTEAWFDEVRLEKIFQAESGVEIPEVGQEVVIDGKLDEPFWEDAVRLGAFRVLGEPGKEAKIQTGVKLASRSGYLYLAYEVMEPEMDSLVVKTNRDDLGVYNDDCVETFFSGDGSSLYHFLVNPEGCKGVEQKVKTALNQVWYSQEKEVYSGDWSAAAAKGENRWTVEIRLDLKDLQVREEGDGSVIYANFCRNRPQRGDGQYSNWAGLTGQSFHNPFEFIPLRLAWKPAKAEAEMAQVSLAMTSVLPEPNLLVAGKPVMVVTGEGLRKLPGSLRWEEDGVSIDESLKHQLAGGLCVVDGGELTLRCSLWPEGKIPETVSAEKAELLAVDEAFCLKITLDIFEVSGKTRAGVLRGLATLALMGSWAKSRDGLPVMTLLDAPRRGIRGWVTGGTPEDMTKMVDTLFLMRYNTLLFEVSTYGKWAAFPFESHPDICSPEVDTKAEKAKWALFADYARARAIRLVPVFYSWSRAGFILNKPRYKHLAEDPTVPHGKTPSKAYHNKNFCSSNPESYSLLFDLFAEIVDTLKVQDLHIGHDEVFYDDLNTCPLCQRLGVRKVDWFTETVARTEKFLKTKGVRLWIYADCLDPAQNGRQLEFSGEELLKKLPRDIVLQDWKYGTGSFPSLKLFKDAGFTVVGSSWYKMGNVADLNRDIHGFGADGFCGTSWNATTPENISPELVTAFSLGAYLSWSPENCNLAEFPYLPAVIYQAATYGFGRENSPVRDWRRVTLPEEVKSEENLAAGLGFGGNYRLDFLASTLRKQRGVWIEPFSRNGQPVGILVKGESSETAEIPLSGKANFLTFLHCTNLQPSGPMHETAKEYKGAVPGEYVVHYADGSSARIELQYRRNISSWNDNVLATNAERGIFGTAGKLLQVNIPAFTWKNPEPEKEIVKLEIRAGNRIGLDLALLGLSFGATLTLIE
jgi:hypothetical protein